MKEYAILNYKFNPSLIKKKEVPPRFIKNNIEKILLKDVSSEAEVNSNRFFTEIKLGDRSVSILMWQFRIDNWSGYSKGFYNDDSVDSSIIDLVYKHPEADTNAKLLALFKDEFGEEKGEAAFLDATGFSADYAEKNPDKEPVLQYKLKQVACSIRTYADHKFSSIDMHNNYTNFVGYSQREEKKAYELLNKTMELVALTIADKVASFLNHEVRNMEDTLKNAIMAAGISKDHIWADFNSSFTIDYKGTSIFVRYIDGRNPAITVSANHDIPRSYRQNSKEYQRWEPVMLMKEEIHFPKDIEAIDFKSAIEKVYQERNSGKEIDPDDFGKTFHSVKI